MISLAGRFAVAALGFALGLCPHFVNAADSQRLSIPEAEFRASIPCPSTGLPQGTCKGYLVDRIIPRLCGGSEEVSNMQWLTLGEAKLKARWDRIGCRAGRKLVLPGEFTFTTEAFAIGEPPAPVQVEPLGSRVRAEDARRRAPVPEAAEIPATSESGATDESELPHQ